MSPFTTAFADKPTISLIVEYGLRLKENSIQRQAITLMNQVIANKDPLGGLDQLITLQGELARATNGFQNFGKRTNTVINDGRRSN
ncbi:hypothetical protein BGP_2807 [Beggiatoa sp. PS]|nr:hypothetical protein BGP_2807 [Beggiatoa sp. PS]